LVFALRDQQNKVANLKLARENFRRTELGVAAGGAAPLDRAEVQVEFSNREVAFLRATQNVAFAENKLKVLLLSDPLAPEWGVSLLPTDEPRPPPSRPTWRTCWPKPAPTAPNSGACASSKRSTP
jgi:outer membrane protein TolC